MPAFDSSIGRLLLAVVTVAVGLNAMKSQSELWLGVLATLTGLWMLIAVATVIAGHRQRRTFWLAFFVAAASSLTVAFGPWSDRSFRGDISNL